MTLTWVAGACVIAAASFVMGLTGFGIGLVSLALLPFLMSPVTAVVLLTSTIPFIARRRKNTELLPWWG